MEIKIDAEKDRFIKHYMSVLWGTAKGALLLIKCLRSSIVVCDKIDIARLFKLSMIILRSTLTYFDAY